MQTAEERFWNSSRVVRIFTNDEPTAALKAHLVARQDSQGTPALDLGCGGGRNTRLLVESGYDVYACDAHDAMVAQTTAMLAGLTGTARVVQATMDQLPYPDGFFDLVVANGVFHNAFSRDEMLAAIQEAARVLSPSGSLYVNTFILNGTELECQQLQVINQRDCLYRTIDDMRMTLLSPDELSEAFALAGLVVTASRLYAKVEFTGERDVFQGILLKQCFTARRIV